MLTAPKTFSVNHPKVITEAKYGSVWLKTALGQKVSLLQESGLNIKPKIKTINSLIKVVIKEAIPKYTASLDD